MTQEKKNTAHNDCIALYRTRSKGDCSEVEIKSQWRYDLNLVRPLIFSLTRNHYVRCQGGSIFWQGVMPSFPSPSLILSSYCKREATRRMGVKDLFKSAPPPQQLRQGDHSLFVEMHCTSVASLNAFLLLIVHNSYWAVKIKMLLCCRNSAMPRHGAGARS